MGRAVTLALAGLAGAAGPGPDADLAARATAAADVYYVGQEVPIRVVVDRTSGGVRVDPPPLSDADLFPVERRGATDRAGSQSGGRILPFRAVPRRAGRLLVPSFRIVAGDRTARTAPITVQVRAVPSAGRTTAFLGGVGPVEIVAAVEPATVRAGEGLEYRLQLRGPGALGSTRPPELVGVVGGGGEVRIGPLPTAQDLASEVPSRTFRWRLRPLGAGRLTIPPQRVATFDPATGRYVTWQAPGVSVEVGEVAGFEPSGLDYGSTPRSGAPRHRPWLAAACVLLGLAFPALVSAGLARARRRRARRRADAGRLAAGLARRFDGADSEPDVDRVARRVVEALAEYLQVAIGRPPGVVTPDDAYRGIERATGEPRLARAASGLVEGCDRACYAGPAAGAEGIEDASALAGDARRLFEALAGRHARSRS